MAELLTRDAFRNGVFARDGHVCVICFEPGQDAHHIIERRLWPDGGYYLDNGATLCGRCHIQAEQTLITCECIRIAAGITTTLLPPDMYPDSQYDKWGNIYIDGLRRIKGPLFHDESVQKVLRGEFVNRVKYPRTWHLPWSESVNKDDRMLDGQMVAKWTHEIVVTEKMDGENTTMYRDYIHARSIDYSHHVSRSFVRNRHAQIQGDIPENMRICGENLYATHSIAYTELPSFFLVFSIWVDDVCLSWDETLEWCALFGLEHVPVMYRGYPTIQALASLKIDRETQEGYVVRPAGSFHLREFSTKVGKYVRRGHVQTHGHWMRSEQRKNGLR